MTKRTFNYRQWTIAIFPLMELGLFIASIMYFNHSIVLSIIFLLLASICLSFSVHIFFHEYVHRSEHYPTLFNLIATALIGLPFDGYRIHHYNHHQYENGEKDYSTTWAFKQGIKSPRSLLSYVLGWPRQLLNSTRTTVALNAKNGVIVRIKQRITLQKRLLLTIYILLLLIDWRLLIAYLLLIYTGWAFTALQNYGQHPPIENGEACSYVQPLYNRLFFNNGLHGEHHNKPTLSWYQLVPDNNSKRISHAHLLNPFFTSGGIHHESS